jgi:hypothetical protein
VSDTQTTPLYRRYHPQQLIKWTVYTLLLLNWGYYIWDDWQMAQHTLRSGGSFLEWASAFNTSLDEMAWFGLLFLWELETYALSEEADTAFIQWLFLGIRGVCYVFLAHTVISRVVIIDDLELVEPASGISSLCQLADREISFTHNLHYTLIDSNNCTRLSSAQQFYFVDSTAVTDAPGLRVERRSAWIDLEDAVTWLLIMLTIEIAIWLQERDITGGPAMAVSHMGKTLYALLFANAAYWAWLGHWVYAWDQLLWIGGFFAIELNVRDWREEIEVEAADELAATTD